MEDYMANKNLVLYFSAYGTAKKTAEEIAKQVGADLVEIEPVHPYDSNRDHYDALAAFTKQERDANRRPAIKNEIDISGYENIFIGYPKMEYAS
jgi:flavodoxin